MPRAAAHGERVWRLRPWGVFGCRFRRGLGPAWLCGSVEPVCQRGVRVQGATSLEELRQLLGALEHNLRKGWLSPTYIREPVLVKKAFNPVGKEVAAVALASQNECMRLRPADVHPGMPSPACFPALGADLHRFHQV